MIVPKNCLGDILFSIHYINVEVEGHQNRGGSTSTTCESMHVAHHIPENDLLGH